MPANDKFCLDGKTAIVTGGSRGIGFAISMGLAEAGATLVIANRSQEHGTEAAEAISQKTEGDVVAIPTDIGDESSVKSLVSSTAEKFRGIDVLVNNAGICLSNPAENKPLPEWEQTVKTNLTGAFLCSKYVARVMIEGNGGSIVNISSMNAKVAEEDTPHVDYHATKGGMEAMSRQMASEWGKYDIRVNNLAPGFVHTDLSTSNPELDQKRRSRIPLGKIATPEEIIGPAVFLASEASAYMTGSTIVVDGGYTIR